MSIQFEWDERKSSDNQRKHDISFQEAKTVFNDPLSITIYDPDHSIAEDRYIDLELSVEGRLLVVCYTERGTSIRIFSSREATRRERRIYERRER